MDFRAFFFGDGALATDKFRYRAAWNPTFGTVSDEEVGFEEAWGDSATSAPETDGRGREATSFRYGYTDMWIVQRFAVR